MTKIQTISSSNARECTASFPPGLLNGAVRVPDDRLQSELQPDFVAPLRGPAPVIGHAVARQTVRGATRAAHGAPLRPVRFNSHPPFVNMGFWVGSLWGDGLDWVATKRAADTGAFLPASLFAIAWAVALIAVGVWAVRDNRRWVLNVTAVFGAIHFYTQWFERLSATPGSLLAAGLVTLGAALALWKCNSHFGVPPPSPPEQAVA